MSPASDWSHVPLSRKQKGSSLFRARNWGERFGFALNASSSDIKSVMSIVRSADFRRLSTSRETIICASGLIPTEEKYFKLPGTIIMYRSTRKCDPITARKYRAESLIIVFKIVGQVEVGPHVK